MVEQRSDAGSHSTSDALASPVAYPLAGMEFLSVYDWSNCLHVCRVLSTRCKMSDASTLLCVEPDCPAVACRY
jgi:hypothetical protein